MQETTQQVINQPEGEQIPAQRIRQAFVAAREKQQPVLIPYFMSGYPSAAQSVELVVAAAEGGADIIELGMPFSDPLADGATIQHAGHLALERGMTIRGCMEVARQISARTQVPLILMGYYNPVLAYGIDRFCAMARASGVAGLIIPDLPPEEADALLTATQKHGLSLVFLIPPTTPDARIAKIVQLSAQGLGTFIYCVSLSGVTGARQELPAHLQSFIARVRHYTQPYDLPLAIGFGLSKPEHIAAVARYAEGAVVGSALVNLIDQHEESAQVNAVRQYIQGLRQK